MGNNPPPSLLPPHPRKVKSYVFRAKRRGEIVIQSSTQVDQWLGIIFEAFVSQNKHNKHRRKSANHGALESPRKFTILSVSRGNVSLISFGSSTFSYGFSNRDRWSAASVPVSSDRKDCILWQDLHGKSCEFSVRNAWETDLHGKSCEFSVRNAWETVRAREDVCSWHNVVWFTHDLNDVPPILIDIVDLLQQIGKSRKVRSIFGKLILAATAYFVLNERNSRLFKNMKRSPKDIRDVIMVTVRLKLLTFRFKNKPDVVALLQRWKMPRSFRLYGS
nr:reverse transcriptase zinc-binding domain-containing protein [Tanacetum cinerariifolium]